MTAHTGPTDGDPQPPFGPRTVLHDAREVLHLVKDDTHPALWHENKINAVARRGAVLAREVLRLTDENAALHARLATAEALCDEDADPDRRLRDADGLGWFVAVDDLRAALRSPDAPPAVQGPAKLPGNSPAPDAERSEQG